MEEGLRTVISYIIPVVEGCGALVIVLEVLRTVVQYLILFVRRADIPMRPLRIRLGQAMVMGLEFQVAADILRTATAPTWNDILLLAALIALRTVLNFLLEQELRALGRGKSEENA
jgi:uncharacterized membrane protein